MYAYVCVCGMLYNQPNWLDLYLFVNIKALVSEITPQVSHRVIAKDEWGLKSRVQSRVQSRVGTAWFWVATGLSLSLMNALHHWEQHQLVFIFSL